MNFVIPASTTLGCVLAAGFLGTAQAPPKAFVPNPERTLVVSSSAAPPIVRSALLESTLIELPDEEKVASVFAGDTVNWIFDGGHLPSRFISVKPKVQNAKTNVHVISDRGNEYTLELMEISSDQDAHFDAKVLLSPGDPAAKEKQIALPVFVPVSELDSARQQVAAVKEAADAVLRSERSKEERYRSQYPASLHFTFLWNRSKGRQIGLEQIWSDERFTYLRGRFQEPPALYEVRDGKASLINFDFSDGLYTVDKLLNNGYLVIGKKKLEFKHVVERKEP